MSSAGDLAARCVDVLAVGTEWWLYYELGPELRRMCIPRD